MSTVTVADILDAMEKNGYPVNRDGEFFNWFSGNTRACAIGQAALNLKVENQDEERIANAIHAFLNNQVYWDYEEVREFYTTPHTQFMNDLGSWITLVNDRTRKSPQTIARFVRKHLSEEQLQKQLEL